MDIEVQYLQIDRIWCPYLEWEAQLDKTVRAMVSIRINRLRLGNFGDCKTIKGTPGLYELRIMYGAGYRIYFGKIGEAIVIIVCAGDKRSQKRDIEQAKKYWQLYKDSIKNR